MTTSLCLFVFFCITLYFNYLTELIPLVNGIKGYSLILALQHHNVIPGYGIDDMHGALFGVTKTMMIMWFSPTNENRGKEFLIGEEVMKHNLLSQQS